MRPLTASDLLDLWERGLQQGPVRRALEMLAAGLPERHDALDRLPIGQRDALLLDVRERTFGAHVNAVADCSRCGERVELDFELAAIRAEPATSGREIEIQVRLDEYELRLRAPDSRDVQAACRAGEDAELSLFDRCVMEARRDGEPVGSRELPPEIVDRAIAHLAEADPQADTHLALTCPKCGAGNRAPFDIVSFFWREIEDYAVRILREVHALASAYGWAENRILEMSPARRRCYLEMVRT